MKRFLVRIAAFAVIYVVCIMVVRIAWFSLIAPHTCHFDHTPQQHTLLLGPSNGECAWNDSLTPTVRNLCLSGSTIEGTYYRTRYIYEYTQFRPDTIILFVTPIIMIANHEKMYNNMTSTSAWLRREVQSNCFWHDFAKENISKRKYRHVVLTHLGRPWKVNPMEGKHLRLMREEDEAKYFNDMFSINLELIGGYNAMEPQNLRQKCSTQVKYLHKLKDYLDHQECTIVIMSTPLKEVQNLYCDRGFRDLLASIFPPDTPIADYTNLPMPDEYYADWVHLNYLGADYFTHYIIDHGIETVPLSQWQAEANCP